MKKILFIAVTVLLCNNLFACGGIGQQVYSGEIQYQLNPLDPTYCSIDVRMDFDINQAVIQDSIVINWGDGTFGVINATDVFPDTAANLAIGSNRYFTHVYSGKHHYPSATAVYFMSLVGQYRANYANNIASGTNTNLPFYIEAQVIIDSTAAHLTQAPLLAPVAIGFSSLDTFKQSGPFLSAPGSDSIVFDLATPLEDHVVAVPQYLLPDQYCQGNSFFSINHQTGAILWTAPCTQGGYDVSVLISVYRNGQFIGSYMRDEVIYVSDVANGITEQSNNQNISVYPNPASNSLTVSFHAASDKALLNIYSAEGQLAIQDILPQGDRFVANVARLAAGVYFLQIRDSGEIYTSRFVKTSN
ncbi:MAG: hypothetical protein JWO06_3809 [Bacteroidota bacterium]|nr:hypothetical protein [Bacteroidota bacterium]